MFVRGVVSIALVVVRIIISVIVGADAAIVVRVRSLVGIAAIIRSRTIRVAITVVRP